MEKKRINKILLAGEGGQGIQTIAKIMSLALVESGYFVSYIPEFGPEQRGTPSVAFIQYSKAEINYPRFDSADLAVVLRGRAYKHIEKYIDKGTKILFDSSTISRKSVNQNSSLVFGIPATKLAEEKFSPKSQNIIALVVIAKNFLDISTDSLWKLIDQQLTKKFSKDPVLEKETREAFEFAQDLGLETRKFSRPEYETSDQILLKKNDKRTSVIIPSLCKGCGICIEKCPVDALEFGKTLGVYGTPVPEIDLDKCITCGICERMCPDCAIRVEKKS